MAGSGFVLLALFYFLIDVIKLWNGAPFKYPGGTRATPQCMIHSSPDVIKWCYTSCVWLCEVCEGNCLVVRHTNMKSSW